MKTKFGNATIQKGYYIISSRKKGYNGKGLHRLIYEDYYKVTIIDGVHVHHIDKNKLNNDISNLQLLYAEEHNKLHGFILPKEFSKKGIVPWNKGKTYKQSERTKRRRERIKEKKT